MLHRWLVAPLVLLVLVALYGCIVVPVWPHGGHRHPPPHRAYHPHHHR